MLKTVFLWLCTALALLFALPGEVRATCPVSALIQESRLPCPGCFDLSEGGRGCSENCVAQCRAAERSCSGDRAACRAEFQICARRCVVSCDSGK
jgi:hypothetical protein